MKLNFPKITRLLDLRKYATEMAGEIVVWVNPPVTLLEADQATLKRSVELRDELFGQPAPTEERAAEIVTEMTELGEKTIHLFAELWSQGPDEATHFTADEVRRLVAETQNTDPGFWRWVTLETRRMIADHKAAAKNA